MTRSVEILKRRSDFLRVAAAKRSLATPGLVLQIREMPEYLQNKDQSTLRVGYTASKKIGNAVTRNRARRKLRALVSEVFTEKAKANYDYVVIARFATAKRPYETLRRDMYRALKKLSLWDA